MFAFVHSTLSAVLPLLFVLGLVVTVHEYGHFLAARLCGVAIDCFSIGFGRAVASWRDRSGVEWRIGWIPLGGYVRFSGDENAASVPDAEDLDSLRREIADREGEAAVRRYFHFKPLWQRAIVVAAGPFANFVLSSVLFAVLLGAFGEWATSARVKIIQPGSVAERAGFQVGDLIVAANGRPVSDFIDLQRTVSLRPDRPTRFEIERGGESLEITATPRLHVEQTKMAGEVKIGRLGITPPDPVHKTYGPVQAVGAGIARTGDVLDTTVFMLGQMVTGHISPSNINGILGIGQAAGAVAEEGAQGAPNAAAALLGSVVALLSLAAVISVSIGFMNLLPVPVLDGGHLLFYAYEALARRPVGARVQAAGYRVGLALLLGLMVFATWNDLQRLRVFQILGGLFS